MKNQLGVYIGLMTARGVDDYVTSVLTKFVGDFTLTSEILSSGGRYFKPSSS